MRTFLLAFVLVVALLVNLALAEVRPCGEFQILCDCQLICQHGTQFGPACEQEYFKAEVCAKGSVVVDSWLLNVLATQRNVSDSLAVNYAQQPSTHNSCITKAEGYGVRFFTVFS
jgi:hypothetical protein